MRERYLRKLQKHRHLAEIAFNILRNPVFKNLSKRDRDKLATIIYRAELIDMELRGKDTNKVLQSFEELMNNINIQLIQDLDDDEDNDEFPPRM
jgi:hypothetical protein